MRVPLHFAIGLIFGLGLVVSGMVNPAKVQNFLDIYGSWDPSLAFVMAGAVMVAFVGYRLAWRRTKPLLDDRFHLPEATSLDRRLLLRSGNLRHWLGFGRLLSGSGVDRLKPACARHDCLHSRDDRRHVAGAPSRSSRLIGHKKPRHLHGALARPGLAGSLRSRNS